MNNEESIRIVGLGVGTALLLAFSALYILVCFSGIFFKQPERVYIISSILYAVLCVSLMTAKRKAREEDPMETDPMYTIRMFLGSFMACCTGVSVVVLNKYCYAEVMTKEIEPMPSLQHQKRTRRDIF